VYCPSCGKDIPDHSSFCLGCGKAIHLVAVDPEPPTAHPGAQVSPSEPPAIMSHPYRVIAVLFAVALAIVVLIEIADVLKSTALFSSPKEYAKNNPVMLPRTRKLLVGQTTVGAGKLYWVRFSVNTAVMKNARVVGHFSTTGGSGNDIQAVIADEDNFENWKHGHQARSVYSTDKVTVGSIDTPILASGTYYLGLSNMFSALSDKEVTGTIELRYQVSEFDVDKLMGAY
jgi:hypothetical protein